MRRRWPQHPVTRGVLWLIAGLTLLYVIWLTVAYTTQRKLLFAGANLAATRAGPPPDDVTQVWRRIGDHQRVRAWFATGNGRSPRSPGPAVLYCHGSSDLLDTRWPNAHAYIPRGISALAVEYRGYGRSAGQPSYRGIVDDALWFYDWLARQPAVDPDRIIINGMSLGGAIAAEVAEQRPAAALVLEASFTSLDDVAEHFLVPPAMALAPFDTIESVRHLDIPVLIMHGRDDDVIPFDQARRLAAAARHATLVAVPGGHYTYGTDLPALERFLAAHDLLPATTTAPAEPGDNPR